MTTMHELYSLSIDWMPFLLSGVGMTLLLATGALTIGLVIGGVGAALKLRGNLLVVGLMEVYTTIVRGVPELIVVYYFYFGLNEGLKLLQWVPGAPTTFELPILLIALAPLGFIGGALATELFRSAYYAAPQSEIVAARAFAMPPLLLFRRILLPHIVRHSLPGLGNIWIGLLKESALISVMGVTELLRATTIAANSTGAPFLFYLLCTALYLVIALCSGGLFAWLERRYEL
ncbi:ABC transporter permease subunit [Ensifer sp. ENS02]|uniref:ABC transporter permease subunit n=1 Tax=Ensifer sp. ENS02 TaxID=2769290 RepID=UPI00178010B6|nr:ABC transporter permease subunit [Ensifer sp. ENS02]MBD9524480.1 ABC transporter permease subunit [Ensifer sp. ENS02]